MSGKSEPGCCVPNLAHLPLEVFSLILDDLSAFAHVEMGYAYDSAECYSWQRSPEKAKTIWAKTVNHSVEQYGQLYRTCLYLWKWWYNEVTCRGPPTGVRSSFLFFIFIFSFIIPADKKKARRVRHRRFFRQREKTKVNLQGKSGRTGSLLPRDARSDRDRIRFGSLLCLLVGRTSGRIGRQGGYLHSEGVVFVNVQVALRRFAQNRLRFPLPIQRSRIELEKRGGSPVGVVQVPDGRRFARIRKELVLRKKRESSVF
jgi:hypothetical protein